MDGSARLARAGHVTRRGALWVRACKQTGQVGVVGQKHPRAKITLEEFLHMREKHSFFPSSFPFVCNLFGVLFRFVFPTCVLKMLPSRGVRGGGNKHVKK